MKHARIAVSVVLLAAMLLSGCGMEAAPFAAPSGQAQSASVTTAELPVSAENSALRPAAGAEALSSRRMETDSALSPQPGPEENVFSGKFEGDRVEGSAGIVDGKYRFETTKTDGEAWHIKLECNYHTVPGRDYRVTYKFSSSVAGTVKFGDFQEFPVKVGENTVTGVICAAGGLSYMDLQLGALPAGTVEFDSVLVEELTDKAEFEDVMPRSFRFDASGTAAEQHDDGYEPQVKAEESSLTLHMGAAPSGGEVWQSKLFVRTGVTPENGCRYRVSATLTATKGLDFEICYNNADREKGYAALYGQHLEPDTSKTVEQSFAVPAEGFNPGELVLQFALGKMSSYSDVTVTEIRVETVKDEYRNVMPAGFALDGKVSNGKTLVVSTPYNQTDVPLTAFSYSGTDAVFERHDDGYVTELTETASSATLAITRAPAADRGVWKAKLYAATGLTLEAGSSYRISFDLKSAGNQARYEACFDGDYENAYGALYDRSLTAGGTDHVELIVTPDVSHGPLTLRLQLGETDSTAGNTVTLSGLQVEKLTPRYQSAGSVALSTGGAGNVSEEHYDGVEQTLTASGGSATLNVASPRGEGGVWSSKLLIRTGVTPEAGTRYRVSAAVAATGDTGDFEILYQNSGAAELYGGQWGLSGAGEFSSDFTAPASGCGELTLVFQLGNTAAPNTITVSNIQVREIFDGAPTALALPGFAYPVTTAGSTANKSFDLEANSGAAASLSGDGSSATATVTTPGDDWHVKLYAKPGLELEAGQTYTIRMDVAGAAGCTACYKNTATGAEDGFGTEAIVDGTVTHTVTPTENGTLEILLKIGSVPAGTAVTVSKVQIKKTTTDYIPSALTGFAYPAVTAGSTANNSFELEANSGAAAVLTGNGSSATATVTTPGDDWHVKLYAKPGLELEAGKTYRISMNVTGAAGCTACYKNTATGAEDGFGTETIVDGTVTHTVTPTANGTLELLLKIGNVPAGTAVTVSDVQISVDTATAVSVLPSPIAYPGSFDLEANSGAAASLSGEGSSATATVTVPGADWNVKFYIKPHTQLAAGKTYRVSLHVTNASGCPVCFKDLATGNEEGFGVVWIGSGEQTVTHTVTPASDGELEIMLKIGNVPADTAVTVSGISVDELTTAFAAVELPGFAYPVTVPESVAPNSFELEANSGAAATLTGDGSSATATVTVPGADWNVKLYAKTGLTLEAGKSYRISMKVTGVGGWNVCYKRAEGGENDFDGTLSFGETVTNTVTPAESGTLEILLKLGAVEAGGSVTVSDIQVAEYTTGELDVTPEGFAYPVTTPGGVTPNSFDLEANSGAAATLSGNGSSASATVTTPGDDWHVKFYAKPGLELEAGKTYTVGMTVSGAEGCQVCYKNTATGAEDGFGTETAVNGTVTHTVTASESGTLEIMLKIGTVPAGSTVTLSGITVSTLGEGTLGENLATASLTAGTSGNVNFWAHEDYAAALSGGDGSVSLAIGTAPAEGGEAWKVKLFAETGIALEAGKHYRISADVSASAETDYEICYNNGAAEKGVGALYGLHAAAASRTAVFEVTPEDAADLILQFNLGWAAAPCTVTVSNVKVEEMVDGAGESLLTGFRYDSVGSFSSAADDGYIVSLEKAASAATFRILQTPAERNPWNVKLHVLTGFTPKEKQGYIVSFDLTAEKPQGSFEVFYDGAAEAAYGQLTGQSLTAGKQTFSYTIVPGDSKGALSLQLRFGKTDGTDGNSYTVSNVRVQSVSFNRSTTAGSDETAALWAHDAYSAALERTAKQAEVSLRKTPGAAEMEPWKTKLFIATGVTLQKGVKYRISFDVTADKQTDFEVCFNRDGEEKGFGAMYGLTAYPETRTIEYTAYAGRETYLIIQLSLGKCAAPNNIRVTNVKVEKAGDTEPVSTLEYSFS